MINSITEFINNYDFTFFDKNIFLLNLSKQLEKLDTDNLDLCLHELFINNEVLRDILFSYVYDNKIDLHDIKKKYKNEKVIYILKSFCNLYGIIFINDNYINQFNNDDLDIYKLYKKDFSKYNMKSNDEVLNLISKVKKGDKKAKEELILSNEAIVISRARKYFKSNNNIDLLDLIQEGNIGLIIAANYFNENKNTKFSTYAIWHIDNCIRRFVNRNYKKIRYPENFKKDLKKYLLFKEEFYKKNGKHPNKNDIMQSLKYNEKLIELLCFYENLNVISLDADLGEDLGDLHELIPSSNNVEEEVIKDIISDEVLKIIESELKKERDKEILYKYIKSDFNITIGELAKKYGVSRQCISDIVKRILKQLKDCKKLKMLYDVNYDPKNPKEDEEKYIGALTLVKK